MTVVTRLARVCLAMAAALTAAGLASQLPLRAQSRAAATPGSAQGSPSGSKAGQAPASVFDIRMSAATRGQALQARQRDPRAGIAARMRQASQAAAALRASLPDAEVRFSPITGGVELVRAPRGALTPAAPGTDARAIATRFLQDRAALFGLSSADISSLRFQGESRSARGLRMVRFDQAIDGRPVFQSDSRFLIDRDGRLVRALGQLMPTGLAGPAVTASAAALSPQQALVIALQSVGISIVETDVTVTPGQRLAESTAARDRLTVAHPAVGGVTAHLVYFGLAPGVFTLAYQLEIFTSGPGDWLTLVDAADGAVLFRRNARNYQTPPTVPARFGVYVQADGRTPADSPAPLSPTTATFGSNLQAPEIARTNVDMATAMDPIASPAGWLADATQTTTGNNVDACVDRIAPDGCDLATLDADGRPLANLNGAIREFFGAAPRDFSALPAPIAGNPGAGTNPTGVGPTQDALRRAATTQLFYTTNWYHDRLHRLGFDEAAGNFQAVNFSGQGTGGDAVRAEVQDSSGTDNANFSTMPDGGASRMQMFRFVGPTPARDAAFDAEVVIHELTHGLTNRLVGNATGINFAPARALGEGWGDFYALSLLNATQADQPNGVYAMGAYATYRMIPAHTDNYLYGIRRYPYTTDNTINPLTWADVDDAMAPSAGTIPESPLENSLAGGLQVHNAGELWALSLWEVRSRVIADPAGAAGNVAVGNETMLQLVTDALKLTPVNPSFIDARDALLDADCVTNGCANERWIWEGFADRGLGYGAIAPLRYAGFGSEPAHMGIGTSFAVPALDISGRVINDAAGNGNGGIDPGEPVRIAVTLKNPWRQATRALAGATATLTTATPGVTILNGNATYGAIAPNGTAAPTGGGFLIKIDGSLACGGTIPFTVTTTSALGTATRRLELRVGTPGGLGAPMTFTKTGIQPIPDNRPKGVTSTMIVPSDLEIADLDFRVDELRHTFTGDLTVMLRAPNGYGADLIWLRGGLYGVGDGDDFIDTIIDQESTNDLNQTEEMHAPFTGRWAPAFNSEAWDLIGDPNINRDPVGQLSRVYGTSSQGPWTVFVADHGDLDTGSLHKWSLIVTPRAYTCNAFVDADPPVTTINLAPAAPNGTNGWYTSAVTAQVAATDGPTAGIVTETRCVIDPATPPATFAAMPAGCALLGVGAPIASEGTHTIYAASMDIHGNAGLPASATFKVDRTPPVLTCPVPPRFSTDEKDALIIATVTDALSGAPPTASSVPVDSSVVGPATIAVRATDAAGNVGTVNCGYTIGKERTYYLTEGSTGFFKEKVAIANPNPQPAPISITYVKDSNNERVVHTRTLEPMSRTTIDVNAVPEVSGWSVSIIVTSRDGLQLGVERTMTWDERGYGGHGSLAADTPRLQWTFGEGALGFYSTYFFLLNPNAESSTATVRYLRERGEPVVRKYNLPAFSRQVIDAGDVPELAFSAFGMAVDATRAIVAERAMYYNSTPGHLFQGGHASLGAPDLSRTWYFAEGATGEIFNAYILIANPGVNHAALTLRFLLDDGTVIQQPHGVGGGQRISLDVESLDPRLLSASFALEIKSTEPVVAERAMYWGGFPWGESHDSLGLLEAGTDWVLGEGQVGGPQGHQTYILLGNTTNMPADVTVTYVREGGRPPIEQRYRVGATSRYSIPVNGVPGLQDERFGARVTVTNGVDILVERAMYWNAEGIVWAGGTNSTGKLLVPVP